MQHYKTRLLSGCRVTASRLSPLWHTHIHPDKHTCTRTSTRTYYKICVQHLDSVAYCDDCSPSGDWETFTVSIVAVSLFSLFVIVSMIFFLASFIYRKLTSNFPRFFSLLLSLSVNIMSFYGAMIFPIVVMQTTASYQRALFTYGLL